MSRPLNEHLDTISLRGLSTIATIGSDAWDRSGKPQPLILSLYLTIDTTLAASSDNIAHTFSYGQMCKDVDAKTRGKAFWSIDHLSSEIASLSDSWPGETLKIVALAPKALLRVEGGFGREVLLRRNKVQSNDSKQLVWHMESHKWFLRGLKVACVIGVNKHERLERQTVITHLEVSGEEEKKDYVEQTRHGNEMWRRLVRGVCEVVEASSFETLEALAALIATTCLTEFPIPQITVAVEKPSALTFVEGAGVEITRSKQFLQLS